MKTIFNQIKRFENIELQEGETFSFTLSVNTQNQANKEFSDVDNKIYIKPEKMEINKNYKVIVKKYMTESATPQFDFQDKWNNGVPMPLCVMQGTVLKETRGMVYMNLEGVAEQTCTCAVCGKTLTNPISKLYGIGPECSAKIGLMRIESEEEAREKYEDIKKHLVDIKWEGWVIRSAIKEWEEVKNGKHM